VVWDAGHDALAGDDPRVTLELVADRLAIVNLKNAVYTRTAEGWRHWWVPGPDGMADWSAAFAELARLGWTGPVCLSGEYSDKGVPVEDRLRADLHAAQEAAGLSAPAAPRSARSASPAG
jgi:sugar phosphate isomerase/epimerase